MYTTSHTSAHINTLVLRQMYGYTQRTPTHKHGVSREVDRRANCNKLQGWSSAKTGQTRHTSDQKTETKARKSPQEFGGKKPSPKKSCSRVETDLP